MNEKTYDELTQCNPRALHFFHVLSNIRPLVWVFVYLAIIPIFALIYWGLPDQQFRIPDGSGTDFGSWIYYSIVTITTLGFGDYTPAHVWAQTFTAVEVALGLVVMGLFLNSVGSMKSEIDVQSEVEKQRRAHFLLEKEKLVKRLPIILHNLKKFLDGCYEVTTPVSNRKEGGEFNPDFKFQDMADMFNALPGKDGAKGLSPVSVLVHSASKTSLALDSMETKVDLTLWPDLLEDCFSFVAGYQMFASSDSLEAYSRAGMAEDAGTKALSKEIASYTGDIDPETVPASLRSVAELYAFIKEAAPIASRLESALLNAAE